MRCYICNRVIDEPRYNQDHKDYDPCDTCRYVIEDLVASYEDRPAVSEDELDPIILEGLYPHVDDPFETEETT